MSQDTVGLTGASSVYLLYDADCGPCARFMRISKVFDYRNALIPVSLRTEMAAMLVRDRISKERMMKSFHIVLRRIGCTQIFSGGDGLIHLLHYFPFGKITAELFRRHESLRCAARWVYDQATRIRNLDSCALNSFAQ